MSRPHTHAADRIRHHTQGWCLAGLKAQQILILEAIRNRQPAEDQPAPDYVTVAMLAADLGMARGTMQEHLKVLESAGWIISKPSGPNGYRRQRQVVLADSAQAMATEPVRWPDRHRSGATPAQVPAQVPAHLAREGPETCAGVPAHKGQRDIGTCAPRAEPVAQKPNFAELIRAKTFGTPMERLRAEVELETEHGWSPVRDKGP